VEVDEIDIPDIAVSQEAIIEIDALPDTPFHGKVSTIYPLPDNFQKISKKRARMKVSAHVQILLK